MMLMKPRYVLSDISMGVGNADVVFAVDSLTGEDCVAKILNLNDEDEHTMFLNEMHILGSPRARDCPNVIRLRSSFLKDNYGVLILEKMEGDLFNFILDNDLTPERCCRIFYDVCRGVKQCHDSDIAHMDIKPENILQSQGGKVLKLADFGTSKSMEEGYVSAEGGTLQYSSPELLSRSVMTIDGKKSDIWSLGILFHVLVTKSWPFVSPDPKHIRLSIIRGELAIDPEMTEEEEEVMKALLVYNPFKRPTIDQVLALSYFGGVAPHTRRPSFGRRASDLFIRIAEKIPRKNSIPESP